MVPVLELASSWLSSHGGKCVAYSMGMEQKSSSPGHAEPGFGGVRRDSVHCGRSFSRKHRQCSRQILTRTTGAAPISLVGSVAEGRMDLMTLLMHELRHVIGLGHVSKSILMPDLILTSAETLISRGASFLRDSAIPIARIRSASSDNATGLTSDTLLEGSTHPWGRCDAVGMYL